MNSICQRRLPVGAEVQPDGRSHFRVWAPRRRTVAVVLEGSAKQVFPLDAEENGYFAGFVPAPAGTRYRFQLEGETKLYPDPVSRFQPEGPHGPSQIVDPTAFAWTDQNWRGLSLPGQVIYEMHLGTFTPEGTWAAALRELPELAATGITVIEIMPLADFAGAFGWGYDGVNLFAPTRLYGTPDDARRFIDRAHSLGMGVLHDVVYNHLGPDGNYLGQFSKDYVTDRYKTDWGPAINYDGPNSAPVREYIAGNAAYWIDEYHFDGLRLDATQNIYDSSGEHILAVISRRVRQAAHGRATIVVTENEPQNIQLVRSLQSGGYGFDGMWNDDFHHTARVALTGRNEAYFTDYHGTPQEFISAIKRGFLYQGQRYLWQKKRRGTPTTGVPPATFVTFLENHDQVSNTGGKRPWPLSHPGRYRALTALLLLSPGTPMLFQGQEFASSQPFFFFADHQPELAHLVYKGRKEFLAQFPSQGHIQMQERIPDPVDSATFERCKLDFSEREKHAGMYALHRDLLRLRREDPVFRAQRIGGVDGAVLGAQAFVLRFFGVDGDDRLLLVNLGRDLFLAPAPEPLLAPNEGRDWQVLWTSEDARYGGDSAVAVEDEDGWRLPGESAVVMTPTSPQRQQG
ncbi:MAG TPA: malto-oligosyltrehalose trehalohydrolase [Gemmataceae bacterium]|nr:malto-oligosyltrehalose trehalohydrolase [Gemmataceae bacterium]